MTNQTHILREGFILCALAVLGNIQVHGQSPVTAIDILLEPDAAMLQHSAANNARLLKVFPKGFALDATHRPHITMVQRFVRTADLDQVYARRWPGPRPLECDRS